MGLDRSLLGAIALGLATAALGSIFLAMNKSPPPKRRTVQAPMAAAVMPPPNEIRVALPAAPPNEPTGVAPAIEPSPAPSDTKGVEASDLPPPPSEAPTSDPKMDQVNQYLWGVYQRSTAKHDGSGDFTWKDIAAAARLRMTVGDYVIVGMDADFREILYRAGRAMDAAGFRWTILSGFRDDYRQGLAAGYKARTGISLHGGSLTTGGYGHGCAVDINDADGRSVPLWQWVDASSGQINIERPLPGIDPAHMQPRGPWHELAAVLRQERLAEPVAQSAASEDANATAQPADLRALPPSEADMACIGLHHHRRNDSAVADNSFPRSRHFGAHGKGGATEARENREATSGEKPRLQREAKSDAKTAGKTATRAADAGKNAPRGKAGAHGLARHAVHIPPRDAGSA